MKGRRPSKTYIVTNIQDGMELTVVGSRTVARVLEVKSTDVWRAVKEGCAIPGLGGSWVVDEVLE